MCPNASWENEEGAFRRHAVSICCVVLIAKVQRPCKTRRVLKICSIQAARNVKPSVEGPKRPCAMCMAKVDVDSVACCGRTRVCVVFLVLT